MSRLPEIQIAGAFNARDVGGHPTVDGRVMSTGVVYRSASLDSIDAAGRSDLASLGVRLVIDLRSEHEIERSGRFDPAETGIDWHHAKSDFVPPAIDPKAVADTMALDDPMAAVYLLMIGDGASMFREALGVVAAGGKLPAVIHCTSGKDRTGILSFLLQTLCGVPMERSIADFERSAEAMSIVFEDMYARFPEMSAGGMEKMQRMAGVEPAWLLGALDEIGGVDAVPEWLVSIGVTEAEQAAIRGRFLD